MDSYDNDWMFLDDDLFPIEETEEEDTECGSVTTPTR